MDDNTTVWLYVDDNMTVCGWQYDCMWMTVWLYADDNMTVCGWKYVDDSMWMTVCGWQYVDYSVTACGWQYDNVNVCRYQYDSMWMTVYSCTMTATMCVSFLLLISLDFCLGDCQVLEGVTAAWGQGERYIY